VVLLKDNPFRSGSDWLIIWNIAVNSVSCL
jgi:hypothetical protein